MNPAPESTAPVVALRSLEVHVPGGPPIQIERDDVVATTLINGVTQVIAKGEGGTQLHYVGFPYLLILDPPSGLVRPRG